MHLNLGPVIGVAGFTDGPPQSHGRGPCLCTLGGPVLMPRPHTTAVQFPSGFSFKSTFLHIKQFSFEKGN